MVAKYGLTGVPETFFVDGAGRSSAHTSRAGSASAQLAEGIEAALTS